MKAGEPSRTARAAARYRAAHQVLESGRIFRDALAVPLLGVGAEELRADEPRRAMRFFVAARSRFAEDAARGAAHVVVLGAGLDTFAYRNPAVRVTEVDHPATQAWKRDRLAAAGIAIPPSVEYLGVDFERESLADRLVLDGPAFFLWLGVVPYLTLAAFDETLRVIAGHEVVFDYAMSPDRMPPERRAALQARADRVARIGEPWLSYFEPAEIQAKLRGLGFTDIEDLGPAQLAARYFDRPDVPPDTPGGHVLRAGG